MKHGSEAGDKLASIAVILKDGRSLDASYDDLMESAGLGPTISPEGQKVIIGSLRSNSLPNKHCIYWHTMIDYSIYKRTSPQQKLFGIETQISPPLRSRLESSWAYLFRLQILPILFRNEDRYAILYGETGRPNFTVARVLGLCLLQEWNDLSDQEALDTYSFDITWGYALDVSDEEDYLSRRSLVEFRRRLTAQDPEMTLIRHLLRFSHT